MRAFKHRNFIHHHRPENLSMPNIIGNPRESRIPLGAVVVYRDPFRRVVRAKAPQPLPVPRPQRNRKATDSDLERLPAAAVRGACSYGTYQSCHVTISNLWDLWRSRIPGEMRYSRGTSYLFELMRVVVLMGKPINRISVIRSNK